MDWKIKPSKGLRGEIKVPADKSISHRAVMFGSIAKGEMRVTNFLPGEDCMRTLEAFRSLGIKIGMEGTTVTIQGKGLKGLTAPKGPLYMGNSGTSMRIISGILAAQPFTSILTGDGSLSKRPMKRVIEPLKEMGAEIISKEGGVAPLEIRGKKVPLKAVDYRSPVASAQVKSCVLAAGLYASGTTSVTEPFQSRDHTERMLEYFSAGIKREGLTTKITGLKELTARDIDVPGDISSAAFFMIAGLLVPGSDVTLRDVGINKTRRGILDVLNRMGANIDILDVNDTFEPKANIRVRAGALKGTVIKEEEIPLLIDEIPILVIAASMAQGRTIINGIGELKVKETDRVASMTAGLAKMGITAVKESGNSLVIDGGTKKFHAASLDSLGDHRTAMSFAIASLLADGECEIKDTDCVNTSYPNFIEHLKKLSL